MVICILHLEVKKMNKKIVEKKEQFVQEIVVEEQEENINPSAVTCENMGDVDSSKKEILIFNDLFKNLNEHLKNLFYVHHLYTQKLV